MVETEIFPFGIIAQKKENKKVILRKGDVTKTRPGTRLPKSRAGGQGPYLRSPDNLGGSSEVKEIKS